ncbi:MAG: hypothetical protein IPL33_09690 [Sphingobacteriales bacterium]|nr:hypothetical protein [Sphingobacteriales bacterium]
MFFSVQGNHDYGDYFDWDTADDKAAGNALMEKIHADMGWDLLLNEHRIVEKNGHKIAVIGVENWSKNRRFSQYGNLPQAYTGCEDCNVSYYCHTTRRIGAARCCLILKILTPFFRDIHTVCNLVLTLQASNGVPYNTPTKNGKGYIPKINNIYMSIRDLAL